VLLRHSLRQAVWHLRVAHGGIALRLGQVMCLLLVGAGLGAAIGHAFLRRGAWADEGDETSDVGT
jgi:hypothetical protein